MLTDVPKTYWIVLGICVLAYLMDVLEVFGRVTEDDLTEINRLINEALDRPEPKDEPICPILTDRGPTWNC